MTAGNNGTGTPENDDPFAHLYRSEGGEGPHDSAPAAPQPGVPRTSYNQVRTVGSRQYGPRQPQSQPQPPYAQQPSPHYAAPETLAGGVPRQPASHGGHGGHGGASRPKRTGLLVAAIAVVAVVAGGIGVAMMNNSGTSDDKSNQASSGGEKPAPDQDEKKNSKEPEKKTEPKNPSAAGKLKRDASTLKLSGAATTEKDTPGAKAANGAYVVINQEGAGVEWEVNVKSAGDYRLYANYGVPGTDNALSVTTNSSKSDRPIGMKNYGNAKPGEWVNFWVNTWTQVTLKEGKNTIKLSCEPGNKCDVHLDQVWLQPGGA
ncbi:carbohydrate-binding protein [Streptomyces telluris]|uniref:Carbohydrate-binding protein n=1 Tax=Streptomyces telluris TaxID=2720021 RepID=A0A9X2RM88_9ACTN|nr:carbohydrate-binding protein [Streptomyces telluris]MCQ8769111.1 carbohydrate-binding protein [Streptomyces telluris]NJP76755.1 carbohydrate-binding protein [Streptomyces telluris]